MNIHDDYNDYELVSLAQELNEDAIDLLHKKYQPLIKKKCNKYLKYLQNKGFDINDLIQECIVAFEEAIRNFNQNDEGSFYTFANICIDRQLINELRKQNREKNKVLNEAVPLESINEDDNTNLINFIGDNSINPELDILSTEDFKELYDNIVKELTDLEECVFKLKIQGFTYKEIADIFDKDDKSIDNAIQRIKVKIKELMNKNTY